MSLVATPRRLPGIRFESRPRAPRDVLPRMDIAAFVGFAETGPVDVPVAVEDVAQFEEVFGGDPRLFWDAASGEDVRGYLAEAVRAFFRGGGARCWVVRVTARSQRERRGRGRAFPSTAVRARFPLPGLVRVASGTGAVAQAEMAARAVGSWSDAVQVGAGLTSLPLRLVPGSLAFDDSPPSPGGGRTECLVEGHPAVGAGDMVRVAFPDRDAHLMFVVGEAAPSEAPRTTRLSGGDVLWVAPPLPPSPPAPVAGHAWPSGHAAGTGITIDLADDGSADVKFDSELGGGPAPGTLIPVETASLGKAVLAVDEAWTERRPAAAGSPPGAATVPATRVFGRLLACSAVPPQGGTALGAPGPAEVLTLELRARLADERALVVTQLGLAPSHPRYAGLLPVDEELYSGEPSVDDPRPRARPRVWEDALSPRFPLAGMPGEERPVLYPVDAPALDGATFLGPRRVEERALRRDGLGELDASLFLDPELVEAGTDAVTETADFIRYRSRHPRDLVGVHAVLGIEEVTIVAAPDAVHRPWHPAASAAPPQAPPHEPFVEEIPCRDTDRDADFEDRRAAAPAVPALDAGPADAHGSIHLGWTPVDGAEYVLEESSGGRSWADAHVAYAGPVTSVDLFGRSPGHYAYRVRAVAGGVSSDWSAGEAVAVGRGEAWVREVPGPAALASPPAEALVTGAPEPPSPVALAIHRALVRMCAARGDMLAVLAVPADLRAADVIEHCAALRSGRLVGGGTARRVLPLAGEERTLSFGALYHPWTVVAPADRPDDARPIPPDGAAAAVLARRALVRGAWVAPANEPVPGIVALLPPVAASSLGSLQDAQVNVVRQEPRGFLWLSADTLSADVDLRQTNVRRLLSLLRRVALRYGPSFVFEPHDDALQRRIREAFEEVLMLMLERGAFAGRAPAEAFRVSTLDPPNTAASVDQGRLVVEVKVAPSVPMRFLTVRVVGTDQVVKVEGA